jgi:hypothetical protein
LQTNRIAPIVLWLAATAAIAQPPAPVCKVEPFRGATSHEGAQARMAVINTGQPCTIRNYGVPEERAQPAHSGRITAPAQNGAAVFEPPIASYTPRAGFVGDDEFSYEAQAAGRGGALLTIKVRVKVKVSAAP